MQPAKRSESYNTLGNFEICLDLVGGNKLRIEMTSALDGRLYRYEATDDTLSAPLKDFFVSTVNVHAVLEDMLKTKDSGIAATDLGHLRFSIVACKVGAREIRKDFEIQLKEVEMDKFDRLERVVKKLNSKQSDNLDGYKKLTFEPDKSLGSFANIIHDGDAFSNKLNGNWMSVVSSVPVPDKGKHYCEIELAKWAGTNRNLMFGLCSGAVKSANSSYGQAESISMYLPNNNTSSLYERAANIRTGSFGLFEEGDRIIMRINMDTSVITWCFGGEVFLMTRIGKELRAKPLFLKIETCYTTEKIRFV